MKYVDDYGASPTGSGDSNREAIQVACDAAAENEEIAARTDGPYPLSGTLFLGKNPVSVAFVGTFAVELRR